MGKNRSIKYGQKLLGITKKLATNALTTASKRALQKTADATGDLVRNKIADKITSAPLQKTSSKSIASTTLT